MNSNKEIQNKNKYAFIEIAAIILVGIIVIVTACITPNLNDSKDVSLKNTDAVVSYVEKNIRERNWADRYVITDINDNLVYLAKENEETGEYRRYMPVRISDNAKLYLYNKFRYFKKDSPKMLTQLTCLDLTEEEIYKIIKANIDSGMKVKAFVRGGRINITKLIVYDIVKDE